MDNGVVDRVGTIKHRHLARTANPTAVEHFAIRRFAVLIEKVRRRFSDYKFFPAVLKDLLIVYFPFNTKLGKASLLRFLLAVWFCLDQITLTMLSLRKSEFKCITLLS